MGKTDHFGSLGSLLGLSLYNGYYYFNAWKAESYFRSGWGTCGIMNPTRLL